MANPQVTREQWLDLGVARFGAEGPAGLRVESLARRLRCSKGGFYWYFGTKREFEALVIDRWRALETRRIIAAAEAVGSPREKLRTLFDLAPVRESGDFLFHLRALAQRSARLAAMLAEIEAERMGYVERVLRELGQEPAAARERAEIMYHYFLGWTERNKRRRLARRELGRQLRIASHILGVRLGAAPRPPRAETLRTAERVLVRG